MELSLERVTVAGTGAILLLVGQSVFQSFRAGMQVQDIYATKKDVEIAIGSAGKSEDAKHDIMTAEQHDFSNKNRAAMEAKFTDYQTQNSLALSKTTSQLDVQGVKIDQLMEMVKELSQSRWGSKK